MSKPITSIGISGVLTLAAHDLNNQGSEGNVTLERLASIVHNGDVVTVNAISGDMLKHSISRYINTIAKQEQLPLCKGCLVDNANRINMEDKAKLRKDGNASVSDGEEEIEEVIEDVDAKKSAKKTTKKKDTGKFSNAELSDKIIQLCVSDDLCGIMITEKSIGNIHRKGCFESGMIIGIPEKVSSQRDFHVKFSKEEKGSGDDGSNKGQNIFHRPNNSGEYATVMWIDASHIGQNDYTYKLAITEADQKKRLSVLLKAVTSTFVNFLGAQRNAQMPHVIDFKGSITVSYSGQPAPTVSPINANFREEINGIAVNFNKFAKDSIEVQEFNSISQFSELMAALL